MHPRSIELGRASVYEHTGRETMATYILLMNFTDQGIRKIKDSPKRADAFKDMAKKCGATVKDVFWTLVARFSQIEPAAMLWSVVPLEALDQAPGFDGRKGFVE